MPKEGICMKRLLSLSTLFVLGLTVNSHAAQPQTISTTIGEAVNFVVVCAGFNGVVYEQGARIQNQKLAVPAKIEKCDANAIGNFLPGLYVAQLDDQNVLHIRLAQAATGTSPAPAQSTTFLGLPVAADGTVTLPNGTTTSRSNLETALRINPDLVRENLAGMVRAQQARQSSLDNLTRPLTQANGQPAGLPKCEPLGYTQAQLPNAKPVDLEVPSAYSGYMGNTWNGLPYFVDLAHRDQSRRLDNSWNTASVKFKGRKRGRDEKFLEKVSVVALVHDTQGCPRQFVIVDAAEGNNRWDSDVTVPINADQSVTLLFILEDGSENPRAFGRQLWLQPRAVQHNATPVIVQEQKLSTARDRYNLKTHVFQEDVSGEIKPADK